MLNYDGQTYIIAEAGCNHECDIAIAKRMIFAAYNAGADAIKFQTYKAEKLVTKDAMSYWGASEMRQIDYYKQLDKFGKDEYAELFRYAKSIGIDAFSSPFDRESATMLAELGVPFIKIASAEVSNLGFIKHIANLDLPVIMSTGGCTPSDVQKAVAILDSVPFLCLMACVLSNPATEACLRRIHTLQTMYPYLRIGYSDHTDPDSQIVPMMAVAAGAKVIEKHFTIDKTMHISNHFFAADIHQLELLVKRVRSAEKLMGDGKIEPVFEELAPRRSANRSWHTAKAMKKGETFEFESLAFLRPGTGCKYEDIETIIGARATSDLKKGHQITLEDLYHESY